MLRKTVRNKTFPSAVSDFGPVLSDYTNAIYGLSLLYPFVYYLTNFLPWCKKFQKDQGLIKIP